MVAETSMILFLVKVILVPVVKYKLGLLPQLHYRPRLRTHTICIGTLYRLAAPVMDRLTVRLLTTGRTVTTQLPLLLHATFIHRRIDFSARA